MFVDPLGQYNFEVPFGWAYNLARSHLITVAFTRADRLEEYLIVRAMPTHAPQASDETWYTGAESRAFPVETRPVQRLSWGGTAALFAEKRGANAASPSLQALLVRSAQMDVLVQHHKPDPSNSRGLSDALALLYRTVAVPTDGFTPQFSASNPVSQALQAAQTAAAQEQWDTVTTEASKALALARETYLASVVGGALLPEVPAVIAVTDALIFLAQATADLLLFRDAELLVHRALHTTRKLSWLSKQRRLATMGELQTRLELVERLQSTIIQRLGYSDRLDNAPLPMRRAHCLLTRAGVACERGAMEPALASAQRALEDMLLTQVHILEAPAQFVKDVGQEVRDKLTLSGAQSPPEQAAVANRLVYRSLLADIAGALRILAAIRYAAGEVRGALEANQFLVAIAQSLSRPEETPVGSILPMAGHRRHLAAALLELLEHQIVGLDHGDVAALNWRLDEVEMMLEELKEGSTLRVKQRFLQAALNTPQRDAPRVASTPETRFRTASAECLTPATLQKLADWALGEPPMSPWEPQQSVSLAATVLQGGPAAVIAYGLQSMPKTDAATFWRNTQADATPAALAAAGQVIWRWLRDPDWRHGWAIAALRALDPSAPLHSPGLLQGLEYVRASLVQPPALTHYALAQSQAAATPGQSPGPGRFAQPPTLAYSPFGDPTVREVLLALDLLIGAQEAQPTRLRDVLADMQSAGHPDFGVARRALEGFPPGSIFRQAISSEGVGSALGVLLRAVSEQAEYAGDRARVWELNSTIIRVAARYGCTTDFLLAVHRAAAATERRNPPLAVLNVLEHLRLAAVWLNDASLEAVVQHAIGLILREFVRQTPGLIDALAALQRAVTLRDQLGETVEAAGSLIDLSSILIAYGGLLSFTEEGRDWPAFADRYLTEAMGRLVTQEPNAVTLHYLGEALQNRARLSLSTDDKAAAVKDALRSRDFARAIDFTDLARRAQETLVLAGDEPASSTSEFTTGPELLASVRQEVQEKLGELRNSPNRQGLFNTILDTLYEAAGESIEEPRSAELLIKELESSRGFTYNRWLGAGPVIHVRQIRRALTEDPTQPVVALYLVTRSHLGVIIIDGDQPLQLFPIAMTNQELESLVEAHLIGLLKQGRLRGKLPWERFQREFMRQGPPLVTPLEPFIAGGRTICLIPHRALHGAALHTLPTAPGGTPIGLRTPIFSNPSLTNWLVARANAAKPASGAFVGITSPAEELHEFAEAEAVANLLALTGMHVVHPPPSRLDLASLTAGDGAWRVLHLSSHGIFEPERLQMGLLLSHDGRLPPPPSRQIDAAVRKHLAGPTDLHRAGVGARLAFLASCLSSRNAEYPGDDLMGVTRAWFAGGTADLIAGIWTVISSIANIFTEGFYASLRDGASVAEAVFTARTALAKSHPDPFFWGVFWHQGANINPLALVTR